MEDTLYYIQVQYDGKVLIETEELSTKDEEFVESFKGTTGSAAEDFQEYARYRAEEEEGDCDQHFMACLTLSKKQFEQLARCIEKIRGKK